MEDVLDSSHQPVQLGGMVERPGVVTVAHRAVADDAR
jgi:hypothetical protein